ncbi:eukaryotic translation initiation factor 4E type 1B [Ranitomeya imitator]|uniref:eukaryotic translation initiation factor 4E type 1B n=1 Tax=Ranitomeya imitator TaxID=111125 RepID=UPI0037E7757A
MSTQLTCFLEQLTQARIVTVKTLYHQVEDRLRAQVEALEETAEVVKEVLNVDVYPASLGDSKTCGAAPVPTATRVTKCPAPELYLNFNWDQNFGLVKFILCDTLTFLWEKSVRSRTLTFKGIPRRDEKKKKKKMAALEPVETHPLQSRWALWFFKNMKSQPWQCNLRLVTTFNTVEDFWALHTHIQLASKLSSGCDYSIFKDGIEPMWEDSRNKRGGRWLITLSKQQRHSDLDALWLETLLCLIGEAFDEYSEEVCGAVINIRAKGDKIAIWTREAENREAVTYIGRVYKERLGLSSKVVIGYQAHADTATKSSSLTKNKFVV